MCPDLAATLSSQHFSWSLVSTNDHPPLESFGVGIVPNLVRYESTPAAAIIYVVLPIPGHKGLLIKKIVGPARNSARALFAIDNLELNRVVHDAIQPFAISN